MKIETGKVIGYFYSDRMRNIFTQTVWESVSESKCCSSCGVAGAEISVYTGRKINTQQIKARHYCSEMCQRTFEAFLFRKSEASDERRRIFGSRSPTNLKP